MGAVGLFHLLSHRHHGARRHLRLLLFAFYIHSVWGLPYWLLAAVFTLLVLAMNLRGIEVTARLQGVLVVGQIVGVLVLGILVFIWASNHNAAFGSNLSNMWKPTLAGIGFAGVVAGVFSGVFMFVGFEVPTTLGEESRHGWRTVSRALIAAPFIAALVYVVLAVLWMAPLTPSVMEEVKVSGSPLNVILTHSALGNLTQLTSIIVVFAALACQCGFFISMSRVFYDLARAGSFPRFFGKLDRHGTPLNGMLFISAITFVSILLMTYGGKFNTYVWFVALGGAFLYTLISFANIVYFWREWGTRAIVVNKLIPGATLVAMIYVLVTGVPRYIQIIGIVWAVIGLAVMWAIHAWKGDRAFELEYDVVAEELDDGTVVGEEC